MKSSIILLALILASAHTFHIDVVQHDQESTSDEFVNYETLNKFVDLLLDCILKLDELTKKDMMNSIDKLAAKAEELKVLCMRIKENRFRFFDLVFTLAKHNEMIVNEALKICNFSQFDKWVQLVVDIILDKIASWTDCQQTSSKTTISPLTSAISSSTSTPNTFPTSATFTVPSQTTNTFTTTTKITPTTTTITTTLADTNVTMTTLVTKQEASSTTKTSQSTEIHQTTESTPTSPPITADPFAMCSPGKLLPYPNDCTKFIICGLVPEQHAVISCNPPLLYNPNILGCDWPQNVNCQR